MRVKFVAKFSLLFPFKKYKINNRTCFCNYPPQIASLSTVILGCFTMHRLFWLIWLVKAVHWFLRAHPWLQFSLASCCFYHLGSNTEETHVGRRNNHSLMWNMSFKGSFHWFNKKKYDFLYVKVKYYTFFLWTNWVYHNQHLTRVNLQFLLS